MSEIIAQGPVDVNVMPEPVCDVRGTKRRKWLNWYGKDWERHAVGTTLYLDADVSRLIVERDYWKQQAESLARTVMMDQTAHDA
ncbi:MAG: hypothetical protein IPL32_17575 [Chloracidobacterium sp.]|nr:hypothetical protein [Chloracidobacterium sp.]